MKKLFYFICAVWMAWGNAGNTRFVILIPSYNNEQWVEENVLSALNQKYDHFRVLYVDDASTDNTLSIVQRIKQERDPNNRLTIFSNKQNLGLMKNLYDKIHEETEDEEVVVQLDGDDRLAHDAVLTILDRVYSQKYPIWITFGSQTWKSRPHETWGMGLPYRWEKSRFYRNERLHMTIHLRTFKSWLFKRVKKEDCMYEGVFAPIASDVACLVPMIEMASRGHFAYIPTVLYEYNDQNPISDYRKDGDGQKKVTDYFLSLPAYEPL